jgi:hypothetical protein
MDTAASGGRRTPDAIACLALFLIQLHDELFTQEQSLGLFDRLASTDKRLHANAGLHPEVPVEDLNFWASLLER